MSQEDDNIDVTGEEQEMAALGFKIASDLAKAVRQNEDVTAFEIIHKPESEQKNESPVVVAEFTIGFHSWAVQHVLAFAQHEIKNRCKIRKYENENIASLAICLLHPEMATAWNRRRELISECRIVLEDELRVSLLSLSAHPKGNEAFSYRRWLLQMASIDPVQINELDIFLRPLLQEELDVSTYTANLAGSNYHAWQHRRWCLMYLAPPPPENSTYGNEMKFSEADFIMAVTRTNLLIYIEDTNSNFGFVSCHISDFSGLSYQTFIYDLIKRTFLNYRASQMPEAVRDERMQYGNLFWLMTKDMKLYVNSIPGNVHSNYLSQLEGQISIFDIMMFFYMRELKVNSHYMQYRHESMWCYRKCILLRIKQLADEFEHCNSIAHYVWSDYSKRELALIKDFKPTMKTENEKRFLENHKKAIVRLINANKAMEVD